VVFLIGVNRCIAIAAAVAWLGACDSKSGSTGTAGPKVAESGTQHGSAGGFSAQMAAEMAMAGIGDPVPAAAPAPAQPPAPAETPPPAAEVAQPAGVSSTPIETPAQPAMTASPAGKESASRTYVKPPADVAAIKLDLEPNWERDVGEAGTFSLVVKVPKTNDTRVFSVRYGYEDDSAPIDCDQYRKFLEDRGSMKVTLNRQKGGACYIEGTDQAGVVAFRMLQTYGGKRLLCHGSLYKDPASAALGDLRDKVLMQAKKICETLAL
jgi:hypothetical protein